MAYLRSRCVSILFEGDSRARPRQRPAGRLVFGGVLVSNVARSLVSRVAERCSNGFPTKVRSSAKRIFLNKELFLRVQQNQFNEAVKRVDEYVTENDSADAYGYWSLRKGLLLKQAGELERAEESIVKALEKSDTKDAKGIECDATDVHWMAEREQPILEKRRTAQIYAACGGSFELFVDGIGP